MPRLNHIIAVLVATCLVAILLHGCLPVRAVFLAAPGHKDSKRFAHTVVAKGPETFAFHTSPVDYGPLFKVNDWTSDRPLFRTVEAMAASHNVSAFLVIRNDTLLMEYYHPQRPQGSLQPSYSIAKSVTSALLGIAIQEGHIEGIDEPVAKYLPVLNYHPYFSQLTIRHLLNHTSGIKYSLALDGTIYYGNNLQKGLKRIDFDCPPGTRQLYLNVNSQLLGMVIENATQIPIAEYLQTRLWMPLGMESDAFWSTDHKGNTKTYCCLNATARDYARFGRLYLHRGNWNGQQLVSEDWIAQTLARDTTQGSSFNYNYSWHLGLKEYGDFMAIGFHKQHLYINPRKNLIIVLLAHKENKLTAERANWWYVFRQIADEL